MNVKRPLLVGSLLFFKFLTWSCILYSGTIQKVRICWDNFLAKSRPGLENEAELPRPNKSLNKRKKKSSKGGKKEDNIKKQSQTFVDIIREENSSRVVCAA